MLSLKLYYLRLFFIIAANAKQKRFIDLLELMLALISYYRVDWILAGRGSVQYLAQILAVFDYHKVLYEVIVNNYHATFNGLFYYYANQYEVYRDLQALKTNWVFKTRSGSAACAKDWTNRLYG